MNRENILRIQAGTAQILAAHDSGDESDARHVAKQVVFRLLAELGLDPKAISIVEALLTAAETMGVSEYEIAMQKERERK